MNKTDTERAIAHIEEMQVHGRKAIDEDMFDLVALERIAKSVTVMDTALTALRDTLSRLDGCAACLDFAGMVRADNYCFKCGRKLKEEKQ